MDSATRIHQNFSIVSEEHKTDLFLFSIPLIFFIFSTDGGVSLCFSGGESSPLQASPPDPRHLPFPLNLVFGRAAHEKTGFAGVVLPCLQGLALNTLIRARVCPCALPHTHKPGEKIDSIIKCLHISDYLCHIFCCKFVASFSSLVASTLSRKTHCCKINIET